MSLVVNKENIFFILPESRYAVSDRIDKWMEEDFTIHLTAKLFPETLSVTVIVLHPFTKEITFPEIV